LALYCAERPFFVFKGCSAFDREATMPDAELKNQLNASVSTLKARPKKPAPKVHQLDQRAPDLIATSDKIPDLITRKQLAKWLGVAVITLEIWASNGYGPPPIKLGPRMVRYDREVVNGWLRSRIEASVAEFAARPSSEDAEAK